jgi:hypothetical protein
LSCDVATPPPTPSRRGDYPEVDTGDSGRYRTIRKSGADTEPYGADGAL